MLQYDFLVVGGGAAGFFAASNLKRKRPDLRIGILEKQSKVLQKVKVSGGGRCNVTNSVFEPKKLAAFYPRGQQFLEQSFQVFNSRHTQEWFKERGVLLKTEADGRVFPKSNNSQTIIDCFIKEASNVDLHLLCGVKSFSPERNGWTVETNKGDTFQTKNLMIASGSDDKIWQELERLDFSINPPVPSLFTFRIDSPELTILQGVSFPNAEVSVSGLKQNGPLLITHWGLSGPAILKLSAWGAYLLKDLNYQFEISVNWLADLSKIEVEKQLKLLFSNNPKKNIRSLNMFGLGQRFCQYIFDKAKIPPFQKGAETGKKQIAALVELLCNSKFEVNGKSTFKEEFVTAGGVELEQVNPLTFASIKYPNLFFGGEVLNIDAITGGFNFQAAWTAGWLISEKLYDILQ